jgi:hypothetical protein
VQTDDYQQDGLIFETTWQAGPLSLQASNRYQYHEAVNGETFLNRDEIENRTNTSLYYFLNDHWTFSLTGEYCNRWEHTGYKDPDLLADARAEYRF